MTFSMDFCLLTFTWKGEQIMVTQRFSRIHFLISFFVIGIWSIGATPQVVAETLSYKFLFPVTQREMIPIGDVEYHGVGLLVRQGAVFLENGEMAWGKSVVLFDMIKGAGPFDQYSTLTFQDGSTIITRTKGTSEATSTGVSTAAKWTGEIIKGTGRFEGIKGTGTSTARLLPPEKGELAGKSLGEGTLNYTVPKK
jgi:hypothetical protein